MRLHSLEIVAFGPFKSLQSVDFDRLSTGGLFLLEGPTGAGKTTILDAITYALYGRLSVSTSNTDRLYSGYAESGDKPSVTMEFSVGGRRFRVTRTPPYPRQKRRGEGEILERPTAHLESLSGTTWTGESSEIKEVTTEITRIIGLTANQFTQVAILPQGEFAKFLRADDDQRRELLTTLFATHLYDKITAELEDRAKAARRDLEQAKVAIGKACAAAVEAAGCDDERRVLINEMSDDERRTEFVAITRELAENAVFRATLRTLASAALESARIEEQRLVRLLKLTEDHGKARRALDEHERTRDHHDECIAKLDLATRAAPLRPLLEALDEAREKLTGDKERLNGLEPNPTEEHLNGLGLETQSQLAADLVRRAGELQHLVDEEQGLAQRERAQSILVDEAKTAQKELAKLSRLSADLPERIARARLARDNAAELANNAFTDQQALAQLKVQAHAASELVVSDAAEIELAKAHAAAVSARRDASAHYESLVSVKLAGMSAEIALKLVDGQPCLVCGATEHPGPAAHTGQPVSDEMLAAVKAVSDEADAQVSVVGAELTKVKESRAAQRAITQGKTVDTLEDSIRAQQLSVTTAQQAKSQRDGLSADLAALEKDQEDVAEALVSASAKDASASQAAMAAGVELAGLREVIEKQTQGHPSVGVHQDVLRSRAQHCMEIVSVIHSIAHDLRSVDDNSKRAERQALEGGFPMVADARSALAQQGSIADLQALVKSWDQTYTGLVARLGNPDFEEVTELDIGPIRSQVESAALARESCESAETTTIGEHVRAESRQLDFARCIVDVARIEEHHRELSTVHASVIHLDGLTRGVVGSRRVNLTTYVLRHWFQHVVAAANVRLATMSSGRYQLNRIDESNDRANARTGLTLEIVDQYTGKTRHPDSLSGGETFFTALALALGLADVVKSEAGGVDLDTLFIDEGFGTLDADTLDKVMDVIDDLRERGRVVGIVSHVAELKDRVNERLEVRQVDTDAQHGPSYVRVIA